MVKELLNLSLNTFERRSCCTVPLGKVIFASTVSTAILSVTFAAISITSDMLNKLPEVPPTEEIPEPVPEVPEPAPEEPEEPAEEVEEPAPLPAKKKLPIWLFLFLIFLLVLWLSRKQLKRATDKSRLPSIRLPTFRLPKIRLPDLTKIKLPTLHKKPRIDDTILLERHGFKIKQKVLKPAEVEEPCLLTDEKETTPTSVPTPAIPSIYSDSKRLESLGYKIKKVHFTKDYEPAPVCEIEPPIEREHPPVPRRHDILLQNRKRVLDELGKAQKQEPVTTLKVPVKHPESYSILRPTLKQHKQAISEDVAKAHKDELHKPAVPYLPPIRGSILGKLKEVFRK